MKRCRTGTFALLAVRAIVTLVCAACLMPVTSWGKGPLEVSFAVRLKGETIKPLQRIIRIRRPPILLQVLVKNVTDKAQKIYTNTGTGPYMPVSFEFTNTDGRKWLVKYKGPSGTPAKQVAIYVHPGQIQSYSVLLDPDVWKSVPVFDADKETRFTVRIIYKHGIRTMHSESYQLICGTAP